MVYVQASLLGWRPVMLSWLDTLPACPRRTRNRLPACSIGSYPPCLRVATKLCKMPQPMHEINLAQSLMRLYEALLAEFADVEAVEAMNKNVAQTWLDSLFLFALVWSVGASVDQEGRVRFDATLRKLLIGDVPDELKPWMTKPARKVTQLIPEGGFSDGVRFRVR